MGICFLFFRLRLVPPKPLYFCSGNADAGSALGAAGGAAAVDTIDDSGSDTTFGGICDSNAIADSLLCAIAGDSGADVGDGIPDSLPGITVESDAIVDSGNGSKGSVIDVDSDVTLVGLSGNPESTSDCGAEGISCDIDIQASSASFFAFSHFSSGDDGLNFFTKSSNNPPPCIFFSFLRWRRVLPYLPFDRFNVCAI